MTPEQAIDYLKRNRQYLNISGIAKEANIAPSSLLNFLSGHVDPDGYRRTIPALKQFALAEVVNKLIEANGVSPLSDQEELMSLQKQLATLYKSIADKYKKMSVVSDEGELKALQSSVDITVAQTIDVRERMMMLR